MWEGYAGYPVTLKTSSMPLTAWGDAGAGCREEAGGEEGAVGQIDLLEGHSADRLGRAEEDRLQIDSRDASASAAGVPDSLSMKAASTISLVIVVRALLDVEEVGLGAVMLHLHDVRAGSQIALHRDREVDQGGGDVGWSGP